MANEKSSFWKNRSVLVTGGVGFIGGWLVKALLEKGARVVVFDLNTSSPVINSISEKPVFIKADVRNLNLVNRAINTYKIDTLFHLAAQTIVGIANKDPLLTLETNIIGTYNILEAVRRSGRPSRLIFMSSDKAYGSQKKLPYTENMPLLGANPYDISKSCADELCQMYFKVFKIPVCISRCGNIFGGGDLHFSRLIPDTIRSVFFNKNPIIRSNGRFLRDYVYIDDIVDGHIMLAQAMVDRELFGEAFNFGVNKPQSVLEVAGKILKLTGKENLQPKILDIAVGEIKNQHLCSKKAEKILGWKPKVSFEKGLRKTIDWYENYFGTKN